MVAPRRPAASVSVYLFASVLGLIVTISAVVLAHVAPFPFLFDVTDETIWRMPQTPPPTVYLTFDDGPNPEATPQLLDVLARHGVRATAIEAFQ